MIYAQEDRIKYFLIGFICSLLVVNEVIGAEEQSHSSSVIKPSLFAYRPPKRGAPKARTGGGTRAIGVSLLVLAPNHVGFTSQSQPRLYWYVSKLSKFNTQLFELSQADSELVEFTINLPIQNNDDMQSIDLAKYDVYLKRNVIYDWQIILGDLSNKKRRDLVSGGAIKFVGTNQKLINANSRQLPYLAAKLSLWYDALDGISVLIESESNTNYWILQRADLLEQGELEIIAIKEKLKTSVTTYPNHSP